MTDSPIFANRLALLQQSLRTQGIDLLYQGVADEFQGEYTPACARRLEWLTGFTGSAGFGVFRATEGQPHALFVDGRYTLQAAQEVDAKHVQPLNSGEITLGAWLNEQVSKPTIIGFDPWVVTEQQLRAWKKATAHLPLEWRATKGNLVDAIWTDRPAMPAGEVQLHAAAYAGQDYHEKRAMLLQALQAHQADAAWLTLPDGINWLLNIRGSDIPYNPLMLAYFRIHKQGEGTLFVYERTFDQSILDYFKKNNIKIDKIEHIFSGIYKPWEKGESALLDPMISAHGFWAMAEAQDWEIIEVEDPTLMPKACKNPAELDGMREAHRRDGLSLTRFLHWFAAQTQHSRWPAELEIVRVLEDFRRQDPSYRGPSFATIAGAGAHGAIVHYRADEASNGKSAPGELLLLDSGGQYECGTTDVTRTLFVGTSSMQPTPELKDRFTRVLKGHIALAAVRFPEGTTGQQLDALARQYLWQAGLDYDHGTGHGVGSYLCVHEGPQRISKKGSATALQSGMILSNEPGYYEAGRYGIRIENLVAVIRVGETQGGKALLGFETLTLAPIDTRLVEIGMLSAEERNWLNLYHQRVYKAHAAQLDDKARHWLEQATRAI